MDFDLGYHEGMMMFYFAEENHFVDENGFIIYNLFDYVSPNELKIFKMEDEDMFFIRPDGSHVYMIFPDFIPY